VSKEAPYKEAMSTLTLPMASPKSLKRSFDNANLENLLPNPQALQDKYEQPATMLTNEMPADQGHDASPSVDSSRLSSPAPSHASSSAVRDAALQVTQLPTASAPTSKKHKLTFTEKEARRVGKDFKDRERAVEKARKEQEKGIRDRLKAEEKSKKEEEKRAKEIERETKRLRNEEEKNKKARVDLPPILGDWLYLLTFPSHNSVSTLSSLYLPCLMMALETPQRAMGKVPRAAAVAR